MQDSLEMSLTQSKGCLERHHCVKKIIINNKKNFPELEDSPNTQSNLWLKLLRIFWLGNSDTQDKSIATENVQEKERRRQVRRCVNKTSNCQCWMLQDHRTRYLTF